jgi:hypothetical protein
MPSSPPKATEVRSSGSGKEGEYSSVLIPAQFDLHLTRLYVLMIGTALGEQQLVAKA